MKRILFSLFLISCIPVFAQVPVRSGSFADPYLPGVVHFRVKDQYRPLCRNGEIGSKELMLVLSRYDLKVLRKKFPRIEKPKRAHNRYGEKLADLSLVYRAEVRADADLPGLIRELMKTGILDYAEPHFVPSPCFVPDDDSIGVQYALARINAFAAWDIHKGDTNTVIGITDTGYEPFHPDLNGNIRRNYADPLNGIDDDMDGYVDNFMGWDTGSDDNDPTVEASYHGIHVTGLCCAVNNNNTGMAGTGYNSRFMHIKIANAQGVLTGAYEGLVYAADHGCRVINCSWGGNQYSQLNNDIVRYAAINKNCLVICGAGNNNNERLFYPASYEYAISVGSTNERDSKPEFSNFGYSLDLVAPGDYVLSTWEGGTYIRSGGTSMSAPVVAGAAAILCAAFPSWNSRQIAEQLKISCDRIDTLPANTAWRNKLGAGRLNMLRSLTETGKAALVFNDAGPPQGAFYRGLPGDTIPLEGILINYLAPAQMVKLELSAQSESVVIINPQRTVGSMATLESMAFSGDPFLIKISEGAAINEQVILRLRIDADGYIRDQYLYITVNVDLINVKTNLISSSFRSEGSVGEGGDGFVKGLGFQYLNSGNMLYEGGLMIGRKGDIVADNIRGTQADGLDFVSGSVLTLRPGIPSEIEEYRGDFYSVKSDLPLDVSQRVLVSHAQANQHFVVVEYLIRNTSGNYYEEVYSGLFCDWDLADAGKNKAGWNNALKTGYVHTSPDDTLYAGVQLLGDSPAVFYAIDNVPGGAGGIDATDGFSQDEKYLSLSQMRLTAGNTSGGSDVITVTSGGPFVLQPGGETRLAFALLAANSLNELSQAAFNANVFYQQTGLPLSAEPGPDVRPLWLFPNPASRKLHISGNEMPLNSDDFSITDLAGRLIPVHFMKTGPASFELNVEEMEPGIYLLTQSWIANQPCKTYRFLVAR